MSTVTSCNLFSSGPAVRLASSRAAGRLPSPASRAVAPFPSQRRACPLSVCWANGTSRGDYNPKTDLHPFNISSVILVHPVPPREERWQLKEEPDRVNLWFEVPGQTKDDLAVEIDEDVLVIKRKTKTPPGGGRPRTPVGGEQVTPGAAPKGAAPPDGNGIYARLLLPAGYNKEGVTAELESGVLGISIAKVREQARRKINVDIAVK